MATIHRSTWKEGLSFKLRRVRAGEYIVLRQTKPRGRWERIGRIMDGMGTSQGDWAYIGDDGESQGTHTLATAIYWVAVRVA